MWQRDCRERWKKLETILRVNFTFQKGISAKSGGAAVHHQNGVNVHSDGLISNSLSHERMKNSTRVGKCRLKFRRRTLIGPHVTLKGKSFYRKINITG